MKLRQLLFAAALALTGTQAKADGPFLFSDTSVGARYGISFKEPGIASHDQPRGEDIHKLITNFSHFDVWAYGSNFLNVDALFSDGRDPTASSSGTGGTGATEVYTVYRGQLSPDKIFGINTKIGGVIEAINFEAGFDWNTKNTQFAPNKRLIVAGPNIHFAMPAGFLDVGIHVAHEWNYNGIEFPGKKASHVDFDATGEFEAVWLYPLAFTGLPLDFRGFANLVLPKGKDGFGANTVFEVLARPQLQLDVGSLLFNKKHLPDMYFAVEYWLNKFGNDHTKTPGSYAITPMIGIEVHF